MYTLRSCYAAQAGRGLLILLPPRPPLCQDDIVCQLHPDSHFCVKITHESLLRANNCQYF